MQFRFRLAAHLGKTVAELNETLSYEELVHWQMFDRHIEPVGVPWRQTAFVCAAVRNSNGGKHGGVPYQIADFIPVAPKPQTTEEAEAAQLRAWRMFAEQWKQHG